MNQFSSMHPGRLATAAGLLAAVFLCVAPPSAEAAGLLVADNGFGGVLEIQEQDVRVTINNGVAVTEVEQVFLNTENRVVEALYTFPVPRGASVSNFSMWINGKEMVGEVVEKERARKIYESYKQTRRDPGLLEQVDYKRFEMRVFPIAAGAEQRVKITYAQELDYDHDTAIYVYPLATTATARTEQRTRGRFAFSLEAKSEVPIVAMKSPSHGEEVAVARHSENYWQASLETREGDLNRDLVLVVQAERPRTGVDLIASRQKGDDGYFLLTLTAGKELETAGGGADYAFVLDVSGSMANDGKLSTSRGSVEEFVGALGDDDAVELIAFNISVQTLFGGLQPASAETKARAAQFLAAQRAVGGTSLRPALEAAYRYQRSDRPLNVVVLSDGMTEPGDQAELVRLIRERPSGCTVFCVGVGNEVNRPLLTQLAGEAGGLAAFVSQGDDFQRQAQAFRRKLTRPAAKQVKFTFDGGDVYDLEPALLPNLYYGQPIRVYGRYRTSGPAKLRVQAEVLGSPLDQTLEITLPEKDDANPQIERMWASHRVERLMAEDRAGGGRSQAGEIVRLCEGYSIVSEYASFIVLENDAEYQRWQIERRNATRVERDRAAQAALRAQLDRLRQKAAQQIGPTESASATAVNRPASAQPAPSTSTAASPAPNTGVSPPSPPAASRSGDIDVPRSSGGGGGGAIDPVTALVGLGLAAAGLAARRRKGRSSRVS